MQTTIKSVSKQKQKLKYKLDKIDVNIQVSKHTFQSNGISVFSPYPLYESQKMYVSYIIQCLNNNQNALVQSPTGTGKTISLLCSTLSWVRHEQQLGRGPTRIIYTSRTHSQLKQIVKQIIKTGFNLKLAILGSRDQTCINQDLKELSGQGKELQCRLRVMKKNELYCKYFHHQEYYASMKSAGKIYDLEEIKHQGKEKAYCPFFYEKYSKNIANLILMPYTYLIEQRLSNKEEVSSIIQNSILIFDQAHNIPSACETSKQFTISLNIMLRAIQHLNDMRQQKLSEHKKFSSKKVQSGDEENKFMKSTTNQLQMHASFINCIQSCIQKLQIPIQQTGLLMSVSQFLNCLDKGTYQSQFGSLRNKIQVLMQSLSSLSNDILLKPYWALQSWFSFLIRISQMYGITKQTPEISYYKCQIAYNGSDIKINLLCLDARQGFNNILKMKPKSIILTSGTLSPMNSIGMELQVQFNRPLACPHIMSKQQVNGCILSKGPNKVRLDFSYENRENSDLYKQLGLVLNQIVSMTPNGVIIFVPSYNVLQKIKLQLTNNGLMSKLYAKKNIFFEKSNSVDFKIILQKYIQQATKPKGALLFALSRGKISQGLDFSDEKCRAVIMVGVPYPASKDLKVISKMEYLDIKSKQAKSMNGKQWYVCETIRCINQSIGRIIRNKNDYGSIYLLDQRYKKSEILSQISSWARQCLKIIDDFQEFKFKLDIFQKYFIKKNEESNEIEHFFTSQLGTKLSNKIDTSAISVKQSISINKNQLKNQKEFIQPQKQLQKIKSQLKLQEAQEKKPVSRQKIIFGRRQKSIGVNTTQFKQCPICRMERVLIKNTECIHQICQLCWDIWLKKDLRCPICRVRVREKYLIKP